jgi:hypothetical protein
VKKVAGKKLKPASLFNVIALRAAVVGSQPGKRIKNKRRRMQEP